MKSLLPEDSAYSRRIFSRRLGRRAQKKIGENLRDTTNPGQVPLEINYPFDRVELVPVFQDERRSGQSNLH